MRISLAPLLAAGILLGTVGPAGAQSSGPCVPGTLEPICQLAVGGVTFVDDGDTIDVDLADDGTSTPVRVRITGIQAMEQSAYSHEPSKRRGECHALEATERLEALVRNSNGVVRLAAQDPASRSGTRLRRSVQVLVDGQWEDVGRILISEGHALPLASRPEWAWNRIYSQLAQQAAHAGVGLWNTEYCGGGPPAALKLWVHWNAAGNDALNPSDEWVRIQNLDTTAPVALDAWWLRDSALRRFTFPPGTTIPAGGKLSVNVGAAAPRALGWNLGAPIFDNATDDRLAVGDGAFLFDPQGDLRAWMMYPCREACADPAAGAFELAVPAPGRQTISLRNVGDAAIDLDGYELTAGGRSYAFGANALIRPDETLKLRLDGPPGPDTRLEKRWSRPDRLRGAGDVARLQTLDGIVVACVAWGDRRC